MSLGNEIVLLKSKKGFAQMSDHWKVTARYSVQMGPEEYVRCVRVRGHQGGNAVVMHFSEAEFRRLFRRASV